MKRLISILIVITFCLILACPACSLQTFSTIHPLLAARHSRPDPSQAGLRL